MGADPMQEQRAWHPIPKQAFQEAYEGGMSKVGTAHMGAAVEDATPR